MNTPSNLAPASAFAHYDYTPDTAPTTGDAPAARTTVLIVGDTYPHRERLRALGGRWNAVSRGWEVPVAMAPKALTYPGVYDAADPSGRGALAALVEGSKHGPVAGYPVQPRKAARRAFVPCGYPGCNPRHCDDCDGRGGRYRDGW